MNIRMNLKCSLMKYTIPNKNPIDVQFNDYQGSHGSWPGIWALGPETNVRRRKSHRDLDWVHRSNFVPVPRLMKCWTGFWGWKHHHHRFPGFFGWVVKHMVGESKGLKGQSFHKKIGERSEGWKNSLWHLYTFVVFLGQVCPFSKCQSNLVD